MDKRRINREPLVKHIQAHKDEISKLSSLKEEYPDSELQLIEPQNWLDTPKGKTTITIDCRSEKEYEEAHLPGAVNYPILNNKERDEVGFLYKHFSPQAALFHANSVADSKKDEIKKFVDEIKAQVKDSGDIFVYCWRGGARSAAFSHILKDAGLSVQKIIGGYKGFRAIVHTALYENPEQFKFIVLSGLTGCGKTEILEKVVERVPVLDIELAALHASSLFGEIRFKGKANSVTSQQHFETRLFMQLYRAKTEFKGLPVLTESESRKISRFEIPIPLFDHLITSPVITLNTTLEDRAKRTCREYFYDGGELVRKVVAETNHFYKVLGAKKIEFLLDLIDTKKGEEFCYWFLKEYYDVHYKSFYKNDLITVDNSDIEKSIEEIVKVCESRREE